jgi:hypothetical protein
MGFSETAGGLVTAEAAAVDVARAGAPGVSPPAGLLPAVGMGIEAAVVGLGPWRRTSAPRPTSTAAPTIMTMKLRMVWSFRASPRS